MDIRKFLITGSNSKVEQTNVDSGASVTAEVLEPSASIDSPPVDSDSSDDDLEKCESGEAGEDYNATAAYG